MRTDPGVCIMRDWKTRLQQLLGSQTPPGHTRTDAERFLKETVLPAFREIEEEIQQYDGRRARVYVTGHSATIVIIHRAKEEFYYGIQPRAYPPPRRSPERRAIPYYRAEVISSKGSIGYDVMGFDKDRLIRNFLLEYDKSLRWQPRKQLSIKRNI